MSEKKTIIIEQIINVKDKSPAYSELLSFACNAWHLADMAGDKSTNTELRSFLLTIQHLAYHALSGSKNNPSNSTEQVNLKEKV